MKTIIILLGAFLSYGSLAESSSDESIVGEWKFVNARCEDNRTLSKEEKIWIQFVLSMKASRHFQTDGILIDFIRNIPRPGETGIVTCSFKHTIPYTVSDNILSRLKEGSLVEADCEGDNQTMESTLEEEFKKNIFRDQEFKLLDDQLLFYSSSPDEGIGAFNCGPTVRFISEFERI